MMIIVDSRPGAPVEEDDKYKMDRRGEAEKKCARVGDPNPTLVHFPLIIFFPFVFFIISKGKARDEENPIAHGGSTCVEAEQPSARGRVYVRTCTRAYYPCAKVAKKGKASERERDRQTETDGER